MHMVQIRNLPDDIYWLLNNEADREHRSLGQQAIASIAKALKTDLGRNQKRLELVAELREDIQTKPSKHLSSPVDLIRQDRDR